MGDLVPGDDAVSITRSREKRRRVVPHPGVVVELGVEAVVKLERAVELAERPDRAGQIPAHILPEADGPAVEMVGVVKARRQHRAVHLKVRQCRAG